MDFLEPGPERLRAVMGLCGSCIHRVLRDSGRSVFVFCDRSRVDPRFPRYPPLPVLACSGHESQGDPEGRGVLESSDV